MPLALDTDVAAALGRPLTDAESAKIDSVLVLVSAAILSATGFRFEAGDYIISRLPRRGTVKVPAITPTVTAVAEIDSWDGTETTVTDYTVRGSTLYGLPYGRVAVAFTVDADVPAEIVALAASLAAGQFSGPPVGVSSEMTGPFQVSYVDNTGKVWFSATDKLILKKYKQLAASVSLVF
jgi:hypothetical protein